MTVCKQLNYLRRKSGVSGDYSEELLADGEIDGRNWSFLERVWQRDCSWHGGKYHYILRIDISEYKEGYDKLSYSKDFSYSDLKALLGNVPENRTMTFFSVRNQSPGLWENGFNPNYWLEAELGAYADNEDRLQKIIETGHDMRDAAGIELVVKDSLDRLGPFLRKLKETMPAGIPYHYWWGVETPPPPRKPVY